VANNQIYSPQMRQTKKFTLTSLSLMILYRNLLPWLTFLTADLRLVNQVIIFHLQRVRIYGFAKIFKIRKKASNEKLNTFSFNQFHFFDEFGKKLTLHYRCKNSKAMNVCYTDRLFDFCFESKIQLTRFERLLSPHIFDQISLYFYCARAP